MSSRAAGGRKRQLKPLQEQQAGPLPFNSRGFFSRSKPTAVPALPTPRNTPSPMATFLPTAAHPSPSPMPTRLFEAPHELSVPYHAASPFLQFPPPPAVPPKNLSQQQQQQQQLALNQERALQSKTSVVLEPFLKKYDNDQTQIQASPPPISPMTTTDPVQAHPNATYHSPLPAYSQPYSRPQQLGPSSFHPGVLFTETDHPSFPTLSYHDTPLLHPNGRGPLSVISTGVTSSPTALERPIPQTQTENSQKGHPSHPFFHPGYHQVLEDNDADGTPPSVYSLPIGPNPRSPLRQWTNSSLSLNDSEVRFEYPPTPQTSHPLPSPPKLSLSDIRRHPNRAGILARSIASASSSSLQSSSSLNTASSAKEGFVFPGSRSTARPKISTKTGTPRKFKIKSKPKKLVEGDDRSKSQKSNFYSSTSLDLSLPSTRSEPSLFNAAVYPPRPRTDSRVTIQTMSSNIASSTNQFNQGFADPSPCSCADPSHDPLLGRKKDDIAGAEVDGNRESKRSGFGIRLKKKKGDEVGVVGVHSVAEASLESLVKTLHEAGPPSEVGGTENGGCDDDDVRDEKVQEDHKLGKGRSVLWPSLPAHVVGLGEGQKQGRRKGRSYPLDPYDSLLLESDRHTGELLRKLNRTNAPSFHNYNNLPPRSVLDLGCGQGHWVLDAAIKWKSYGTRITGFDMVDVMKPTRARAVHQGVADNIRFVRGNFLEERLPFSDGTFDFVRMSCLSLCIPSDSWEVLLREVLRVLALGGRLELIDDRVFFPYGKVPSLPGIPPFPSATSMTRLVSHRRASDTYSTCTFDTGTTNRSLELALTEDESATGGLCGSLGWVGVATGGVMDDGGDKTDTATLHDILQERDRSIKIALPSQGVFQPTPQSAMNSDWNQHQATSKDLEALFEHLLIQKYGIQVNLSSFIVSILKEVFGHAREIATMHLTLAPPDAGTPGHRRKLDADQAVTNAFASCPGLTLWPSTLIPMSPAEIEVHALKHPRMLLSCKNHLVKHAMEATEDEEIDEESVLEAVWEYENFLLQRFSPPRDAGPKTLDPRPPTIPEHERLKLSHQSTPSSSGTSVISEISVSAENQDAMWEYQQHLGRHFSWTNDATDDQDISSNPPLPGVTNGIASPSSNSKDLHLPLATTITPPYSRTELTHVRTFRVFEAIKLNEMPLETLSNPSS